MGSLTSLKLTFAFWDGETEFIEEKYNNVFKFH